MTKMSSSFSKVKKEPSEVIGSFTSTDSTKTSDINSNSKIYERNESENVDSNFEFEDDDDLVTNGTNTQELINLTDKIMK